MGENKEFIVESERLHPSLCFGCENARKPASPENLKKGWVGCSLRVMRKFGDDCFDHDEIIEAEEVGEGWVDLKARIDMKPSGIISNLQIVTKGVKKCNQFKFIENE